jgi:hypothetical protein
VGVAVVRRWFAALAVVAAAVALVAGNQPQAKAATTVRSHSGLLQLAAPNQSNNWAGYNQGIIEKNVPGGFHAITGEWVVPTASPHKPGESEYSSTWLGIGGGCEDASCNSQDQTLIQTGTEQDVIYDAVAGTTTTDYSAWYELIPQTSTPVSLPVKPGDLMRASIVEAPVGSGNWTITLQNVTQGQTFTTQTSYQSGYGSAEWIEEAPTVVAVYPLPPTVGFAPVPDLTPVHFDTATVNGASAGLTAAEQFQLVDLFGNPEATPSPADAEADGFNICTYTASCAAPTTSLSTTTSHHPNNPKKPHR